MSALRRLPDYVNKKWSEWDLADARRKLEEAKADDALAHVVDERRKKLVDDMITRISEHVEKTIAGDWNPEREEGTVSISIAHMFPTDASRWFTEDDTTKIPIYDLIRRLRDDYNIELRPMKPAHGDHLMIRVKYTPPADPKKVEEIEEVPIVLPQ